MTVPPSLVSGEFAGRYTIERERGRGATSLVWLARDREHGCMVAIKVLRQELASGAPADRFLREVRVTAQLHHPNIVPVLGCLEIIARCAHGNVHAGIEASGLGGAGVVMCSPLWRGGCGFATETLAPARVQLNPLPDL